MQLFAASNVDNASLEQLEASVEVVGRRYEMEGSRFCGQYGLCHEKASSVKFLLELDWSEVAD